MQNNYKGDHIGPSLQESKILTNLRRLILTVKIFGNFPKYLDILMTPDADGWGTSHFYLTQKMIHIFMRLCS
jgi:hypothetical protein